MKHQNGRIVVLCVVLFLCACVGGALYGGEKAPQKVSDLAGTTLAKFGTDAVIAKTVSEENGKGKSLDQIKELDKKWASTAGVADFMKAYINNPCGKRLADIVKGNAYIVEAFAMDNQGALVGETNKTSDYWQGDEAKFTESFKGGKGAIHIGEVEWDDSAQAYLVQVSVPVKDGGKVIGAITFGIDVDKF